MKTYPDDTVEDQLCTLTNRIVQSLQTNKHCNVRGLRLNLFIRPVRVIEANPVWPATEE